VWTVSPVRGAGPWRVAGRALAGSVPGPIAEGDAVEIATGAMLPPGTEQIIRVEDSATDADGRISGSARPVPDWREPGDEAARGEELLPAGTPVSPAVIGLAAACGYDTLTVTPSPSAAVVIFGDELLTAGTPNQGRIRDALGPQLPGWLVRLGARVQPGFDPHGPVADTLEAHVKAISDALAHADLVCTTGGTMHGPVDHLHPALAEIGATYIANTVAVRPGFPMLLASVPRPDGRPAFVAGLPGNPQSAVVALVSLVVPLLAGLSGRPSWPASDVTLGSAARGRGDYTHLVLVRLGLHRCRPSARACRLGHAARPGPGLTGSPSSPPAPTASPATGYRSYPYRSFPGAGHDRPHGPHRRATRRGGARGPRGPSRRRARWSPSPGSSATTTAGAGSPTSSTRPTPSALAVLEEVAAEIAKDPAVYAVAVSHRVGELAIGDVALAAAVATAHRGEAFALCARLVDTVKERLPVWKHQHFTDGTEEWVNAA
jgi:molybdopterin molybdotransferase